MVLEIHPTIRTQFTYNFMFLADLGARSDTYTRAMPRAYKTDIARLIKTPDRDYFTRKVK